MVKAPQTEQFWMTVNCDIKAGKKIDKDDMMKMKLMSPQQVPTADSAGKTSGLQMPNNFSRMGR